MYLNKVILLGNVGRDPEIRYYGQGQAMASFTLAVTEPPYNTASGQLQPARTDWFRIVCFRHVALNVEQHVRKGTFLAVEGKLRSNTYQDKNGVNHTITEVHAERVSFRSPQSKDSPQP